MVNKTILLGSGVVVWILMVAKIKDFFICSNGVQYVHKIILLMSVNDSSATTAVEKRLRMPDKSHDNNHTVFFISCLGLGGC